jgi:putative DNA primase/helicase
MNQDTEVLSQIPNRYPVSEYVEGYMLHGWAPIPINFREKRPPTDLKDWPSVRLTMDDIETVFGDPVNIGIITGEPSGGLMDVDIDDPDALRFTKTFLPETEAIFGRAGKPASHWLYRVNRPKATVRFQCNDKTIIELRGNGSQTVFPGSVHESGEPIEFVSDPNRPRSRKSKDELFIPIPKRIRLKELEAAVIKVAIATVLFKHWHPGARHHLALAVAGFLAMRSWSEEQVVDLVKAVALKAGDEDVEDRLTAVRTTFEQVLGHRPVSQASQLEEVLGKKAVRQLEKWTKSARSLMQRLQAKTVAADHAQPDTVVLPPNLNADDDAAAFFSSEHRDDLIFCDEIHQWFVRDNEVFTPSSNATVQGVVSSFVQRVTADYQKAGQVAPNLKSRPKINAIIDLSRSRLAVPAKAIDVRKQVVGLKDGSILDLQTRQLISHEKAIVTKRLGAKYDPEATCPSWMAFLDQIFQGNESVIQFMQRASGYSLSGETGEQCLFILIGGGANGKTTFLNTNMKLLGDYAGTTPMQTLMASQNGNGLTNDLAALVGKRFVSASDGESSQKLAESKIKNMTGGDPITCRALYKDYVTFEPQFKLWIATNELPSIGGTDEGIWRRIHVVEFGLTIPADQRDPNLGKKFAKEMSGILNWALDGYDQWKSQGLNPPVEITAATGTYRNDNDTVGQFLLDRCLNTAGKKIMTKDLYEAYGNWGRENGITAISNNAFGKELKRKGYKPCKARTGNGWIGIELKDI